MSSRINAARPGQGRAYTLDVRANFAAAKSEIELLQDRIEALQQSLTLLANRVAALEAIARAGTERA